MSDSIRVTPEELARAKATWADICRRVDRRPREINIDGRAVPVPVPDTFVGPVIPARCSATVHLYLDCGAYGRVDLARAGPDAVTAKGEAEVPAGTVVEYVVAVDGDADSRALVMLDGLTRERRTSRVERVEP